MCSVDVKTLKTITRNVTQNITAISSTSNSVEFNIINPENILIKRREDEGNVPLFNRTDVVVNYYKNAEEQSYETSTPYKNKRRSSPSSKSGRPMMRISDEQNVNDKPQYSRSPGRHRSKTKSPVRDGLKKLENILDGIKHLDNLGSRSTVSKEDAVKLFKNCINQSNDLLTELTNKDCRKRQRNDSERCSRSKSRKQCSKRRDSSRETSTPSRSPTPKRTKKESLHKYGHSSKYESDTSLKNRRHRESSFSRSPSPRRSKNYYSTTKSKRDLSVLSDSFSSSESNYSQSSSTKKTSYEARRHDKYSRYSKRKYGHADKPSGNHKNDLPHGMNAKDIEQRYYRYYAVMYAFTIIMDILRQDGIHSI